MSPTGALTEMTAPFTLPAGAAFETGLVRKDNEEAAYAGRWLLTVAGGRPVAAAVPQSVR